MNGLIKAFAILCIAGVIPACTNQQMYQAAQDIRCQEYYRNEDPHHETKCSSETYEEYQRKREEVLKEKAEEANKTQQ